MEKRDLEIEMYKERIQNLEKTVEEYQSLFGPLDNLNQSASSASKDEKIDHLKEQASEAARKGIEVSKDIFSISKKMFGKAKENIQEEWQKQQQQKNNHQFDENEKK